jgi:ribonuclease HI
LGIYSDRLTVPQAETAALRTAIRIAKDLEGRTTIYSDCKSAIFKHGIVIHPNKIQVHHVPAHVGIAGNEAADMLAKAGTLEKDIQWISFWNQVDQLG